MADFASLTDGVRFVAARRARDWLFLPELDASHFAGSGVLSGMSNQSVARLRPEDLLADAAWMRRLARALLGDPHDADDIVQDTWLAALRHPPEGGRAVRPW